jgi:hypothetical protein
VNVHHLVGPKGTNRGKPRALDPVRGAELAELIALRAWCRRELSDKRLAERFHIAQGTVGNYRGFVPRESQARRPVLTDAELDTLARQLMETPDHAHRP